MTDYDLTGINIASYSPKDMPWIGVDDATLGCFGLNRESLTAEATNIRILDSARKKVRADERFKNVDVEFLKERRIEIDATLHRLATKGFGNI
jgi:hypothetical protein